MSPTQKRTRGLALLVIIVGILLAPVPIALALPIPTLTLWLDFVYETAEQPELEGMQIIGCGTAECSQPSLLLQYGACDSAGCVDFSPGLDARQP